jgi:predicted enzyme related to lactoylglutathione lyase
MPNRLCHFEILSDRPAEAQAFYTKVFDWSFEPAPEQNGYMMIFPGDGPTGGLTQRHKQCPDQRIGLYFKVDSVDDALEEVVKAGGRIIVPKRHIHGVGAFAVFTDPENIAVGVFENE